MPHGTFYLKPSIPSHLRSTVSTLLPQATNSPSSSLLANLSQGLGAQGYTNNHAYYHSEKNKHISRTMLVAAIGAETVTISVELCKRVIGKRLAEFISVRISPLAS